VNGGLARSERRRVKPSAGASSEGFVAGRPHRKRRERIGTRPRVTRDRCSAVATSSKAVLRSWDRGCNGHRILGRVLADGRHPRSSRGVSFHEKASTVVSAAHASSDPSNRTKSRVRRPNGSVHEGGRGVRNAEVATGVSEARSHRYRGKKTPTLVTPGREAVERETCAG